MLFGQWTSGLLVEGLGPGGWASLNYTLDRSLGSLNLQFRAGSGVLRLSDFEQRFNPDLTFPLGLEVGYGGKHQVLAGAGAVPTGIIYASDQGKTRNWKTHYYLMAGYKLRLKNRLYMKLAYSPLFENHHFRNWAAAGVGYYLR